MKLLLHGLHNSYECDCNEWNRLPNSRLFSVIKMFKIEKLLGDLAFSSTGSLILESLGGHV